MKFSNILILHNDSNLSLGLRAALEREQMTVKWVRSIKDMGSMIERFIPDLVILDTQLPDGEGLVVQAQLYKLFGQRFPVVFVSELQDEQKIVRALELGASDFIRRPCGLNELVFRIKRILATNQSKRIGSLKINTLSRSITVRDKVIRFRRREFDILNLLSERPGVIVPREEIVKNLPDLKDEQNRVLDTYVCRIRTTLRQAGSTDVTIRSVYGEGYVLESDGQ